MIIRIEMTDTFGGDPNYSWVKRDTLYFSEELTDLQVVRRVKKAMNITGIKCKKLEYNDCIELRPIGACVVLFITFDE